jgi:tRNA nucleotidyltransferase (CCA-adding enzyme)
MDEIGKEPLLIERPFELSAEETRLFETLVKAAIAYETQELPPLPSDVNDASSESRQSGQSPSSPPPKIQIRVAGGWVRDKLLKQPSQDVDIALDTLSGYEFATIVKRYMLHFELSQLPQVTGKDNKLKPKAPKIAKIEANPAQSKHLETATMKVHSIDVDFVHLRGEEYSGDSRIPKIQINATPLEDAKRRDFTVNSLFYNLRTNQVEDWTGRGMDDLLVQKMLVTPLCASVTFHDDPLRVLRAIRFGVRYGLALSDNIVQAAKSGEVHESLHVKVSRERVGKELEGMLSGKNARPHVALEWITDLKLGGCVFAFPAENGALSVSGTVEGYDYASCNVQGRIHAREKGWERATSLIKHTPHVLDAFQSNKGPNGLTEVDKRMLYLTTFLYPLRNLIVTDAKDKSVILPNFIIRDSIKKNKDATEVTRVLELHVEEMREILLGYFNSANTDASKFCRLKIGLLLRKLKDLWVTTLLDAAIAQIDLDTGAPSTEPAYALVLDGMMQLYNDIVQNNLDQCWKIRPLLNGQEIMKALAIKGPIVGTYIDKQVRWMLVHPDGTKGECESHLKAMKEKDLES